MSTEERWVRLVAIGGQPGSEDLPSLLQDVVTLGQNEVAPAVVGCSISEAEPAGRSTASSAALASSLDQAQFDADDGPCLAAARLQRPCQLDLIGEDGRFASFATAAGRLGVLSSLSLPIPGASRPTSLNLYAGQPAAFGAERPQAIARLLARCAGTLLAGRPAIGLDLPGPALQEALARRDIVLQAKQRLAAQHGVTEPEAFRQLAKLSGREQRSIFEIAREVLDGRQWEDR
jgi:hypothetical protein